MAAPSEPAADEKHSVHWSAWIIWALAIFGVYVFAAGPLEGLADRGYLPMNTPAFHLLQNFYAPLDWLGDNTPLGKRLDAYVDLWRPNKQRKK